MNEQMNGSLRLLVLLHIMHRMCNILGSGDRIRPVLVLAFPLHYILCCKGRRQPVLRARLRGYEADSLCTQYKSEWPSLTTSI